MAHDYGSRPGGSPRPPTPGEGSASPPQTGAGRCTPPLPTANVRTGGRPPNVPGCHAGVATVEATPLGRQWAVAPAPPSLACSAGVGPARRIRVAARPAGRLTDGQPEAGTGCRAFGRRCPPVAPAAVPRGGTARPAGLGRPGTGRRTPPPDVASPSTDPAPGTHDLRRPGGGRGARSAGVVRPGRRAAKVARRRLWAGRRRTPPRVPPPSRRRLIRRRRRRNRRPSPTVPLRRPRGGQRPARKRPASPPRKGPRRAVPSGVSRRPSDPSP